MKLAHDDDVGVAIRKVPAGTVVGDLAVQEEIPMAHKVALHPIAKDAQVKKFGVPIGRASRDIAKGELVHTHNLTSDYLVNDIDHFER